MIERFQNNIFEPAAKRDMTGRFSSQQTVQIAKKWTICLAVSIFLFVETVASAQLLSAFRACKEAGPPISASGGAALATAETQSKLGHFHFALATINDAIRFTSAVFGPKHPDLSSLLVTKAEICLELGEDRQAALALNDAIPLETGFSDLNSERLIGISVALAGLESRMMNPKSAAGILVDASRLLEAIQFNDTSSARKSAALIALGQTELFIAFGQTEHALNSLKRFQKLTSHPIELSRLAEEAFLRALTLLEIGDRLGANSSALSARKLLLELGYERSTHYGNANVLLAHTFAKLGETEKADSIFRQNLQTQVEIAGDLSGPRVADALVGLSFTLSWTEPERAVRVLKQALDICLKHHGLSHASTVGVLRLSSQTAYRNGYYDEALKVEDILYPILRNAFGEESIEEAINRENYGYILSLKGETKNAAAVLHKASKDIEKRTEFGDVRRVRTFEPLVRLSLHQGNLNAAFFYCYESLLAQLGFMYVNQRHQDFVEYFRTVNDFAYTTDLLHNLASVVEPKPVIFAAAAGITAIQKSAFSERRMARAEIQRFYEAASSDERLVERAKDRWSHHRPSHTSLSLPEHSLFVDFVEHSGYDFKAKTNSWLESRYVAYLTFPSERTNGAPILTVEGRAVYHVERVDLGDAAPINAAVAELHQLFAERRIAPQRLEPVLQRLGTLLYAPMARHLTNVAHLIVCPDGQLGRLPFELLPVDAKGRRLVEDKLITYVSSGREVARLAQPRAAVATTAPLVMGNPDFNFDLRTAPVAAVYDRRTSPTNSEWVAVTDRRYSTRSRALTDLKFTPLPDSENEARKAASMLGTNCVLRLGAAAREADLKAVNSPRVLHLATHGFFLSDQEFKRTNGLAENFQLAGSFPAGGGFPSRQSFAPSGQDWENPLIRCGIALAGANRATGITNAHAEDGILTGLEAALLNLQGTELVILSACDSGSGDVKIGEGVMSLRRAFTIAGAETVLASHWKVNDAATSALMTEFMRRWQSGTPRGQAWREAQLSLLRSKDFSNPYFWAAFTLTGQWR